MGELKKLVSNWVSFANRRYRENEQRSEMERLGMEFRDCVVRAVQVQFEQPVEAAQRRVSKAIWDAEKKAFSVFVFAGMVQGSEAPVGALALPRAETREAFKVAVSGEVGDGWNVTFQGSRAGKTTWSVCAYRAI